MPPFIVKTIMQQLIIINLNYKIQMPVIAIISSWLMRIMCWEMLQKKGNIERKYMVGSKKLIRQLRPDSKALKQEKFYDYYSL